MQLDPDGYIDLWSREHYKSTVITFAKSIQDILASHGDDALFDRECTIGIFSHTRPIAKKFLRQIKFEFESNSFLKGLFPDVLHANPRAEATRWSDDSGIVVKRRSNPKEATVEAWGLVDGQPTGSHFTHLLYDDVVTIGSVTSPDMIEKTTDALSISYNLGDTRGFTRRFIGTRYHFADTYKTVIDRGTAKPRLHPAAIDGALDGEPVFWDKPTLEMKVRDMGSYVAACQLMQNPMSDTSTGFKEDDLRYWNNHKGEGCNIYLICDPANEKKKKSDFTAMGVLGLGADNNYYLLDFYRDKWNLKGRTKALIALHKKWKPLITAYEQYGKDSDISHIREVQESINYRFDITPVGGQMSKNDRIRRLIPVFEDHRFYMPTSLNRTQYDGKTVDVINQLVEEEYKAFPVPLHDDGLDMIARIFDIDAEFPMEEDDFDDDDFHNDEGKSVSGGY